MKIKTTIKEIKNRFSKVYRCGYCDMQYIMARDEATYYNCGVYGWNCDIYVDYKTDIAITTGYRNMAGKLIPSELIEKYSVVAKDILKSADWRKQDELLEQNRRAFFEELDNLQ